MAISVKHNFVSAIPDSTDTTIVRPSDWNADHSLVGTVPVANGGTGAATLTGYVIGNGTSTMTASTTIPSGNVSGLGTMATQNANAIAVTGGTVDGTTIGATTPSTGAFSYISTNSSTSVTPTLSFNASNSPYAAGATIAGSYLQHLLQNKSGTAGASTNYVLSNDLGTDSTYYGEFGMNSSVYSAGTPADFFSINNGIYYSGHDGDVTVGSGNGFKTYLAWGTAGQSAHVINATGSIGLNTNATGTTNYGTSGQLMQSAGSAATPTWSSALSGLTIDNTVIGGTTPAAGTFTTITGQTEVLKGTGQNLFLQSNTFTNAAWTTTATLTTGITDPFGGTNATQIAFNTQFQGLTAALSGGNISGITYTLSLWVQVASGTKTFSVYTNTGTSLGSYTATTTWTRYSTTFVMPSGVSSINIVQDRNATGFVNTNIYGAQIEIGSITGTYIPTTTTAVYGTPTLSFSGVAGLGLQSDGSLYVSPTGTGALQAQKTDSTATGGNARGANAVDWQTVRTTAGAVASGFASVISGGYSSTASGSNASIVGGSTNNAQATNSFIGGGTLNTISTNGYSSVIGGGYSNTAAGYFNIISAGTLNSGTSGSSATTQATTIAVTAGTTLYLSATNANIKVGQLVTGTGIPFPNTYATSTVTTGTAAVMATSSISGTTLTVGSVSSGTIIAGQVLTGTGVTAGTYIVSGSGLSWVVSVSQTVASTTITGTAYTFTISQNATTAAGITLSFYTPHGVVVGGGNNQATGSYSFIGGGGDAGTAANRNVASGDWSFVGGGMRNTASGLGAVVVGGGDGTSVYSNSATNKGAFVGGGINNSVTGLYGTIVSGALNQAPNQYSFIGGGYQNTANGDFSNVTGGANGTARGILGNAVFSACFSPIGGTGQSQSALLVLGAQTTDATATVLRSNSVAAGTTNQVILPNNAAYMFTANVISTANFALASTATAGAAGTATITFAAQTVAPFIVGQTIVVAGITPTGFNGTQTVTACTTTTVQYANATTGAQTVAGTITATSLTKAWKLEGCIMRTSAAAGTRLVGSVTSTVLATDTGTAAWTAVAAADTTNGGLKITFTGAAATTIRTVAQVTTTEVTY